MWVRWANLQPSNVQFLQDSVCQNWLKSVHFWRSYSKNKNLIIFGDTVYMTKVVHFSAKNWENFHKNCKICSFNSSILYLELKMNTHLPQCNDVTSSHWVNERWYFSVNLTSDHQYMRLQLWVTICQHSNTASCTANAVAIVTPYIIVQAEIVKFTVITEKHCS